MKTTFPQDPTPWGEDPDTGCIPVPVNTAIGNWLIWLMNTDLAQWEPSRSTRLTRQEAEAYAAFFGEAVGCKPKRGKGHRRRRGKDKTE